MEFVHIFGAGQKRILINYLLIQRETHHFSERRQARPTRKAAFVPLRIKQTNKKHTTKKNKLCRNF